MGGKRGQTWSLDIIMATVILMLAIAIFYFVSHSTAEPKITALQKQAEAISDKLDAETGSSNIVIVYNGVVDKEKLKNLYSMDYETLKRQLGVKDDFCIYLEDQYGRLITLDNKTGIGSSDLKIGNYSCNQNLNVPASTPPVVILNSPGDGSSTENRNLDFNFVAFDREQSTVSCSLYLDGVLNQTKSVNNNTLTIISVNDIPYGDHHWYVSCNDGALTGFSSTYTVTINPVTCNSCEDCTNKLNGGSYDEVKLTANILNYDGYCINFSSNINDVIFDCQGHIIDGDNSWTYNGIHMTAGSGNTVKNCIVSEFLEGIYITGSNYNKIYNNTLINMQDFGVEISSSYNNTVSDNNISDNYGGGIYLLSSSTNNTIKNNILLNNNNGIYLYTSSKSNLILNNNISGTPDIAYYGIMTKANSNNNTIIGNNIYNNNISGIYLRSYNNTVFNNRVCFNIGGDINNTILNSGNHGDDNTCDTTYNWNDIGATTNCTYPCS